MEKFTILFVISMFAAVVNAQIVKDSYSELINRFFTLYQKKIYNQSAESYELAFRKFPKLVKQNDRYNAACAWALANNKDNSFVELILLAKNKFSNYQNLISDSDLNNLHQDKRWPIVVENVKQNLTTAEKKYDKKLVNMLTEIYDSDQSLRLQEQQYYNQGKKSDSLNAAIKINDAENLKKVSSILDRYGWLGPDVISEKGSLALFVVIQHSKLKIQEKYLPLLKQAVSNGKASPKHLALLQDRILIFNGRDQIYGSQLGFDESSNSYYVLPVYDATNLDKRRASIGLEPMKDYVIDFKMQWNLNSYIKNLPKFRKKMKEDLRRNSGK